jgi:lipoprotein signal peptidase
LSFRAIRRGEGEKSLSQMFKKYRSHFMIVFILILLQIIEWAVFRNFSFSLNAKAIFGSVSVPRILILSTCLVFFVLFLTVKKYQFGFGLLLVGSLSNLLDRIFYGGVLDYLKVPYIPTFNFADITITIGAFLIILVIIFGDRFSHSREA